MLKIKIKKILPIWLSILFMFIGIQSAVTLTYSGQNRHNSTISTSGIPDKPAVLGAFTYARGEQVEKPTPQQPSKKQEPNLSRVTADGFLVYDTGSGKPLVEKNKAEKFYVASLTKLMTALVSYDETNLNQYYSVSPDDGLDVSPELRLKPGDKIHAWDLFNAMLVGSANDAAKSLAHFTADSTGKDFVDLMNQKAQGLGMSNSHFSNPMGFDSKYNYSTAEDLKKLVDKTQSLPAFTELGKKTAYKFTSELGNSYGVTATNRLISSDKEIQAIKTGSTPNAKEAMITKVTRDGHSIIVIVLSSQDREGDTLKLSDEVFKAYSWEN